MVKTQLYWIPFSPVGRLAIMPHPTPGERLNVQMGDLRREGVQVIVSLLSLTEIVELSLEDEPDVCRRHQIEFLWLPITDQQAPSSLRSAMQLINKIVKRIRQNRGVAIHCRMGIGRSGMIAAGALMMLQIEMPTALKLLSQTRGEEIPETEEQRRWLTQLSLQIGAQRST
jgi:protein-tyrosine phosphatase